MFLCQNMILVKVIDIQNIETDDLYALFHFGPPFAKTGQP